MGNITACLAANIRHLRKERRLTQSELAAEAGISLIFLQGIESERKWISPNTVASIAKALDVPQSRLFEYRSHDGRPKKIKRISKATFDHVPDDIFNALATTCRHPSWQWEVIRWILDGYVRQRR